MATTSHPHTAAPAPGHRLVVGIRAAVLAALLAGAPPLARQATAQRPAAIRAAAYVTTSILAAGWRAEAAGAVLRVPPAAERVRIAGVGTLDVQSGPGEAVRVSPRVEDATHQSTIVVEVCIIGS